MRSPKPPKLSFQMLLLAFQVMMHPYGVHTQVAGHFCLRHCLSLYNGFTCDTVLPHGGTECSTSSRVYSVVGSSSFVFPKARTRTHALLHYSSHLGDVYTSMSPYSHDIGFFQNFDCNDCASPTKHLHEDRTFIFTSQRFKILIQEHVKK